MSAIKAELEKHNFRHPSFGKTEVYNKYIICMPMHFVQYMHNHTINTSIDIQ